MERARKCKPKAHLIDLVSKRMRVLSDSNAFERIETRVREKVARHSPSESCVLGLRISMLGQISASCKYFLPYLNEKDVHYLFSKFGRVIKVVALPSGIHGGLCFVHMQR